MSHDWLQIHFQVTHIWNRNLHHKTTTTTTKMYIYRLKHIMFYFCSSFCRRKMAKIKVLHRRSWSLHKNVKHSNDKDNDIPTYLKRYIKKVCKLIVLFWQTWFASWNMKLTENQQKLEKQKQKQNIHYHKICITIQKLKKGTKWLDYY